MFLAEEEKILQKQEKEKFDGHLANTYDKTKVKTCFESNPSYYASSDDEENMPAL